MFATNVHLLYFFSLTIHMCFMMNHERYMGICYPLIHRARMTKRFLLKYVAVGATLQILGLGLTPEEVGQLLAKHHG